MPTLLELGQASELALNKYKEAYEAFPIKKLPDGTEARDIPSDKLKGLNDLYTETETTGKAYADMLRVETDAKKAGERLAGGTPERPAAPDAGKSDAGGTVQKSIGELWTESKAFGEGGFVRSQKETDTRLDLDVKTLMQTGTGYAPESTRSGRVVLTALRQIRLLDVIPGGTIGQVANKYMRETTFTNAAAETAEGGQMPEAALGLVEVNDPVQKVAVFLPVTDEQLEDVDGIRSYIDNRLTTMLRLRIESQVLNGNGTSPNLRGYLNVPGIQTQAKGTDPAFDAWLKLLTKLMDAPGFCNPTALVMNPVDWQNLLLTRTADGAYILGNPASEAPPRIWGKEIVATSVIAAGTGAASDFEAFTELLYYKGIDLAVTNSHNDDFTKGRQVIRGTVRLVNTLYRSTAFGTVTGL